MKYMLLIFCFFWSVPILAQPDSLKKYSYELMGFSISAEGVKPVGGTCFFLREKNKIYLITANHVVCGCNDDDTKMLDYPQVLNVLVEDSIGNIYKSISINIKPIRDTCKCLPHIDKADCIMIEINPELYNSVLNSVEKFIIPPFMFPGNVYMFGFPGKAMNEHPSGFGYVRASQFNIPQKDSQIITRTNHYNGRIDSLNYYIYTDNTDTFLRGYSGSPVFVQDKVTHKIRIAGVFSFFGGNNETGKRYIGVPKIEAILNQKLYN